MCNTWGMETTTAPRIWGDEALFATEIRRQHKQETVLEDRFARILWALFTFGATEILLAAYNMIGATR